MRVRKIRERVGTDVSMKGKHLKREKYIGLRSWKGKPLNAIRAVGLGWLCSPFVLSASSTFPHLFV